MAIYDVTKFAAAGDGKSLCTAAIQKAIETCSAEGGGTVYFPRGKYLTGTLFMRSNVRLQLDVEASLLGSTDIADYPADGVHKQRYAGETVLDKCLIYSGDCTNIGFFGPGTIDAQGGGFQKERPMIFRFLNCSGVQMRDLKIRAGASWGTAFILCDNVKVDAVDIENLANRNGDGLDFDSCQNVIVSNCWLRTSDDSICLQNSEPDHPVRNVVVTNCVMTSRWAAVRIGLLSSGDFEDVTISNCVFHDINDAGLKIQMTEGGRLQNMTFDNIVMRNVPRPLLLTFNSFHIGTDAPNPPRPMQCMRNLMFSNMRCISDPGHSTAMMSCMVIDGTPGHSLENITLRNIHFTAAGGGTAEMAATRSTGDMINNRPEYFRYKDFLPAYGVYARHVKGLTLDGLRLDLARPDLRPAVMCDDVDGLDIRGLRAEANADAKSVIRLCDVRDAFVTSSGPIGKCGPFVRVEGSSATDVEMAANHLANCTRGIEFVK